MKFYEINDDYIEYLRETDPFRIMKNKGEGYKQTRKYIGEFKLNGYNYYVPISSPKIGKDFVIKDNKVLLLNKTNLYTHYITEEVKGQCHLLGKLNFKNMIPVPDDQRKEVNFTNVSDHQYRNLLFKEYEYIKSNQNTLLYRHAKSLYQEYSRDYKHELANICPKFDLLEERLIEWPMEMTNHLNQNNELLAELYDLGYSDDVIDQIRCELEKGKSHEDIVENLDQYLLEEAYIKF